MAYGLRTYKSNGSVSLDYTSRITRILYVKKLAPNENGSIQLADFDPTKGSAFATTLSNTAFDGPNFVGIFNPHLITWSGNWVYWNPAPNSWTRTDSWLYVVMYK